MPLPERARIASARRLPPGPDRWKRRPAASGAKRAPLSLAAILAILSLAHAPRLSAQEPTGSITAAWTSEYLFRGQRLAGPSFQPDVEMDGPNWTAGVAASFPTGDRAGALSGEEIDPYASLTWSVSPEFSVQPGATWYTYPDGVGLWDAGPTEGPRNRRQAIEPNLALNFTAGAVKLTPKAYVDLVRHILTAELNASTAVPLRDIGTELDFGATLGGYRPFSGSLGQGDYWLLQTTLPYQLGRHWRAAATAGYSAGFDTTDVPLRASRAFFTLSLAYNFL